MKLMKMTDFVLDQRKTKQSCSEFKETIVRYTEFIIQPNEKWMFVPCDADGNVLEEPQLHSKQISFNEWELYYDTFELQEYKQAQSKVIFKGFSVNSENFIHNTKHYYIQKDSVKVMWNFNNEWNLYDNAKTIEDLIPYNLDLVVSF